MSAIQKGGMNLFQVLRSLPNQGVGTKIVKLFYLFFWFDMNKRNLFILFFKAPTKYLNNPTLKNSYYEVTKVSLKEVK